MTFFCVGHPNEHKISHIWAMRKRRMTSVSSETTKRSEYIPSKTFVKNSIFVIVTSVISITFDPTVQLKSQSFKYLSDAFNRVNKLHWIMPTSSSPMTVISDKYFQWKQVFISLCKFSRLSSNDFWTYRSMNKQHTCDLILSWCLHTFSQRLAVLHCISAVWNLNFEWSSQLSSLKLELFLDDERLLLDAWQEI